MHRFLSSGTLLSIAAGLCGGFAAQVLLSPAPLLAELLPPAMRPHKRPAATEVDAQHFVLVDSSGLVTAEIKLNEGEPEIVLYDKDGRVAWRATTHQHGFQPLLLKP